MKRSLARDRRGVMLALAAVLAVRAAGAGAETPQPLAIDFGAHGDLSTYEWLEANDFTLQRHADDPDRIELYHADDALHVRVKRPSFGMAIRPVEAPQARRLRLHWGVSDYPEGASYQHGVDNEAIMVYVFFGHERLPSGEMFIPASPYFIGFYLCPAGVDDVETPYVGHHYAKTGRYVCVDHPGEGETAVSDIHLDEEFARSFGLDVMPPVSGMSIEIDTTDSDNDGHAAAFLKRLEFLD